MKRLLLALVLVAAGFTLTFAQQGGYIEPTGDMYRKVVDGKQVDPYTIKNSKGMVVKITNYGAKIEQILAPDKTGKFADVVQGFTFIFRSGFNMEPSRFPDSPNKPTFPTTVIKAGEWFSGRTVYKFSTK